MSSAIRTSSRRRIARTIAWASVRATMSRCGTSTVAVTKQVGLKKEPSMYWALLLARNVDELCGGGFGLQPLCGGVRDERIDRRLQHAFHHHVQLMVGQADAVVGEAVLRKVVGADFFTAVARADL